MIPYSEFELNEQQLDVVKKKHAAKAIIEYIKENGDSPEDVSEFYTATDEEIEKYKLVCYSKYISEEEFAPVEPEPGPTPEEPVINNLRITITNEDYVADASVIGGNSIKFSLQLLSEENQPYYEKVVEIPEYIDTYLGYGDTDRKYIQRIHNLLINTPTLIPTINQDSFEYEVMPYLIGVNIDYFSPATNSSDREYRCVVLPSPVYTEQYDCDYRIINNGLYRFGNGFITIGEKAYHYDNNMNVLFNGSPVLNMLNGKSDCIYWINDYSYMTISLESNSRFLGHTIPGHAFWGTVYYMKYVPYPNSYSYDTKIEEIPIMMNSEEAENMYDSTHPGQRLNKNLFSVDISSDSDYLEDGDEIIIHLNFTTYAGDTIDKDYKCVYGKYRDVGTITPDIFEPLEQSSQE